MLKKINKILIICLIFVLIGGGVLLFFPKNQKKSVSAESVLINNALGVNRDYCMSFNFPTDFNNKNYGIINFTNDIDVKFNVNYYYVNIIHYVSPLGRVSFGNSGYNYSFLCNNLYSLSVLHANKLYNYIYVNGADFGTHPTTFKKLKIIEIEYSHLYNIENSIHYLNGILYSASYNNNIDFSLGNFVLSNDCYIDYTISYIDNTIGNDIDILNYDFLSFYNNNNNFVFSYKKDYSTDLYTLDNNLYLISNFVVGSNRHSDFNCSVSRLGYSYHFDINEYVLNSACIPTKNISSFYSFKMFYASSPNDVIAIGNGQISSLPTVNIYGYNYDLIVNNLDFSNMKNNDTLVLKYTIEYISSLNIYYSFDFSTDFKFSYDVISSLRSNAPAPFDLHYLDNKIYWSSDINGAMYGIYNNGMLIGTTLNNYYIVIDNGVYSVRVIPYGNWAYSDFSNSVDVNLGNTTFRFDTLITTVLDGEIRLLKSFIGYDVLGVNIFNLMCGIITLVLIIFLLKFVIA